MYCRNCGKEVQEGYVVCPSCGTPPRAQEDQNNGKTAQNVSSAQFNQSAFNGGFNPHKSFGDFSRSVASFAAKDAKGWVMLLKVISVIYCITLSIASGMFGFCMGSLVGEITGDDEWSIVCFVLGSIIGVIIGIIAICKNMIYANMAENTNIIAKNTAENNKR